MFQWSPSDRLDTNRFQWKSSFSIREGLKKIPPMLDEGVESRSDGVHRVTQENQSRSQRNVKRKTDPYGKAMKK